MRVSGKSNAEGITFSSDNYVIKFINKESNTTYILRKNPVRKTNPVLEILGRIPFLRIFRLLIQDFNVFGLVFVLFLILDFTGITTRKSVYPLTPIIATSTLVLVLYLNVRFNKKSRGKFEHFSRYHGAEHKVIMCHNCGKAFTRENIRASRRISNLCGTMFAVHYLFVYNITEIALALWNVKLYVSLKFLFEIAFAFELYIWGFEHEKNNPLFKLGYWLQEHVLTREPTDAELEQAIKSFEFLRSAENGTLSDEMKDALKKGLEIPHQIETQ